MANPSAPAMATRYANLEIQVGNVATQLGDFIKESKDYRERDERERLKIWEALQKQGDQNRAAIEKLTTRWQISWPAILTTVSVLLSLIAAGGWVIQMLVEARMRQLEIADSAVREVMESRIRHEKELDDVRFQWLHELGRENHDAIRDLKQTNP